MILLFLVAASCASALDVYASPDGSDSNDCLSAQSPCKTVTHACTLFPQGVTSVLYIAHGTYDSVNCNIYHFRFVLVVGDAADRTAVVLRANSGNIFWVQDHATLILKGVTLTTASGGSGVTGVATRQFAIADYWNTDFGTLSVAVNAAEMSKINCGPALRITGNVDYYVAASGGSTVSAGCATQFVGTPSLVAVYWIIKESRVEAQGATFSGSASVTNKYILDHSTLYLPKPNDPESIPGATAVIQNGGVVY
jgi:hypothetical protein